MKVFPTGDPDNYRVVCWEDAPEPGTPGLEVRRLDGGA